MLTHIVEHIQVIGQRVATGHDRAIVGFDHGDGRWVGGGGMELCAQLCVALLSLVDGGGR